MGFVGNSDSSHGKIKPAFLYLYEGKVHIFSTPVHGHNYPAVSIYQKRGVTIDIEEYPGEPYFSMGMRLKKKAG